ncbi:MAG TPA: CocE/NonD family hydrolase [Candidatus Acidoferrum sp.]
MTPLCRRLVCALFLLACSTPAIAQETAPPPKFQIPTDKLAAFVGQYVFDNDPDLVRSVSLEGSRLFIESSRSAKVELVAESEDTFGIPNAPVKFKFLRSAEGKTIGFNRVVEQSGEPRANAERIDHAGKISDQPLQFIKPEYTRQEVMIPMRDGIKLHAVILRPKDSTAPLPFLMERTPYGVDGNTPESINPGEPELAASRYIFVFEDIRGRYKSEGTFVMSRPMADHRDGKLVDESTDTYDTVDWLLKNVPNNNGRVGVFGVSYPGFLAMAAGIDPHPAVKAISPQAPMIDVWKGDDFFHNGAFRETYGYDYTLGMESSKENAFSKLDEDAYDFFLHSGSFAAAAKRDGVDKLPTGVAFLQHPAYDEFWRARGVEWHLNQPTVPTLFVGGFWDQEDMFGPQEAYARLEPHDTHHGNFLVIGPWNHGQWGGTTRHLGEIYFGEPTTDEFRKRYEAPFFAHYLKDEGGFSLKNTAAFESGSNRWREYTHWPPAESKAQNLYLSADGSLLFSSSDPKKLAKDKKPANYREYVSDPGNPVPYRHRPIQATYAPGSKWFTWMVEDQRFVSSRPDVATWTTAPLDHDVTVAGDVIADLFASTSGTDADWVVKLIDEYPEAASSTSSGSSSTSPSNAAQPEMSGYQLMVNGEIFRGRYRKSFEHPEAIPANEVEEYRFSLHAADHTFLKGHRIKVQVQNTWFPLYDRNPQKFLPNIMTATPDDFVKATVRIYPISHVILPVAP